MNQVPFRQQPAFRSVVLGVVLLGIFLFYLIKGGGFWPNVAGFIADLILLAVLYQVCMFFYAQFILPTHSLDERRRITARLHLHAAGGHGPAVFVRNGRKVERTGESEKKGPGLLWVDTASAVVTRTPTTFKQVLGPGVHFIEANEKIASIISLHIQTQTIGPHGLDRPFEKLKENPTPEERRQYEEMMVRCTAVRAMTRDGIEVIPTIKVRFKINAQPAGPGEKGSRFGFNAEAVERAARGEGINPDSPTEEKRRVSWNQLPGLMAAELWREYLNKFMLSELFDPSFNPLPEVRQPEAHASGAAPAPEPLVTRRGYTTRLLRRFNNNLEQTVRLLAAPDEPRTQEQLPLLEGPEPHRPDSPRRTALQVISEMINARLSQGIVTKLDESGRPTGGHQLSDEHRKLSERGIVVLSASVSAIYLDEDVERQLLSKWTTSWLSNAQADSRRIDRLHQAYAEQGRHRAQLDHALFLSQAMNDRGPSTVQSAVKVLLEGTAAEIRASERLASRVSNELESLQSLEKWLEDKQP